MIVIPEKEVIVGNKACALIGARSYSIFIWHQVLLAFYRYFFSNKITIQFSILFFVIVAFISEVSYQLIEKRLGKINLKPTVAFCAVLFVLSCGASAYVFMNAGVVRDVPELDVYTNNVHRGMHAEYCDRVYSYDHDFENNGSTKVLVVGNSFARDWGNILIESGIPLDMSYSYSITEELIPRIKEAEYIFYNTPYDSIPAFGFDTEAIIYGISTKRFGESNGIIYKNRGAANYFEQTVEVESELMDSYYEQQDRWGDKLIDMIKPVEVSEGIVRVFTDDHKFISQDCRHLTRAGARYYALLIDLNSIFGIK